ncbi:hypothetical protein GGU11DRAFT_444204 [Lentinula aff. detonsa]|nr:hypothetical protein GGU11DRAFT_444204 [Lentinula aff. detonsa]
MNSDNKHKVITALELLVKTCEAAKSSISNHPKSTEDPPPLSILHKDLLSLLSLVYGSVTKLALALKPLAPTHSACLVPLKELSDRIAAISHCINMFNASIHGATLVKEVNIVAVDVVESMRTLASVYLEIEKFGERSRFGDDYLVRTGAVHSIIEMARSEDGLPNDNLTAVRRHWSKDTGGLEDGIRELGEMIEDARSEIDTSEDGWDELGIEPSKPLAEHELKVAEKAFIVLRLCSLLHQKVISDILSTPDSLSNTFLDGLAALSPALVSSSDELISTLDSPQDMDCVKTELLVLKGVIDDIQNHLSNLNNQTDSLADLLRESSLNEVSVSTNCNSREKWFNGCFDQIAKAIQSVPEAANGHY